MSSRYFVCTLKLPIVIVDIRWDGLVIKIDVKENEKIILKSFDRHRCIDLENFRLMNRVFFKPLML